MITNKNSEKIQDLLYDLIIYFEANNVGDATNGFLKKCKKYKKMDSIENNIEKMEKLGEKMVELFGLEKIPYSSPTVYLTNSGTKTLLGLGRSIHRINEGIYEQLKT